jgi:ABC-type phosphate/phosphonate transport system substrate-binding protein
MPRSFLMQAGIDADKDFKRVAFSGAHDATIAAVAAGKVEAGALNISVWEKFVADKKVDLLSLLPNGAAFNSTAATFRELVAQVMQGQ